MALAGASYLAGIRIGFVFFLPGAFTLWFFRDPYRRIIHDDRTVLAACDGKVMQIKDVFEPKFLKCRSIQIVTFLSPLDVHINRAPIAGVVKMQKKVAGGFLPAFLSSSEKNERNYVHIQGKKSDVLVVQIAGIVARRIVSWVREGEKVHQGHKIGMIRFGSRTDVFVPITKAGHVLVKKGDRIFAGKTPLVHLRD